MAQNTLALMDKLDSLLVKLLQQTPWDLFPWALQLSLTDQRAFLLEMLDAVRRRDDGQLSACLEDWQATAEALKNTHLMNIVRQPYDLGDYISWKQVRGELDISSDPEE
jgi:hypothetical protein